MKKFSIILSIMLFYGCISPLEIDNRNEINLLVVEGFITTDFGPHEIKLQRSAKYGSIFDGNPSKVNNAFVAVRDIEGNLTPLERVGDGVYNTPADFRAEVGKTYSLIVEISEQLSYISLPQTVVPVPEIDSIFFTYKETPRVNEDKTTSGLNVIANFQDPADEENFYMWNMNGVYRINTRPDLYIQPGDNRGPAPKDCCDVCYISEGQEKTDLMADNQFNGNEINRVVGFLNDDGGRFQTRYELEVEMFSLTKEAHRFYQVLNDQLSISGSIFDSPPATIGTNMINTDNPEVQAIGYFGAYDVARKKVFADLSVIEDFQPTLIINDDCRLLPNSTTTLPIGWPITD